MGSLYGIDRGILIIRLYKKVVETPDSQIKFPTEFYLHKLLVAMVR